MSETARMDDLLIPTPSQTAGPFHHLGFDALCCDVVLPADDDATPITVRGRVIDGDGLPVPDAALEIWQADADGTYATVDARGFGRVYTDPEGRFRFTTIRPGVVRNDESYAPHLVVILFMRGLLRHVTTRMYFPDDRRNDVDPVLARVPADRRATLIAHHTTDPNVIEWDVVLQGEAETVFLEW